MGGEVGGTRVDRWIENSEAYRNKEENVEGKTGLGKQCCPGSYLKEVMMNS